MFASVGFNSRLQGVYPKVLHRFELNQTHALTGFILVVKSEMYCLTQLMSDPILSYRFLKIDRSGLYG